MENLIRTYDRLARGEIALAEKPHLILGKSTDNAVQHASVVEQDQIALLPIMRIYEPRRNPRPLQPMHNLPHLLQIINHHTVFEMDLAHSRGMDLQRQLARDGILPRHGQDLDFLFVDCGELRVGKLEALGDNAEAVRARFCGAHPHVRVGRVFDAAGAGEFLVGGGEDVVHFVAAHKGCGAEGHLKLIACAVIVPKGLRAAFGNRDSQQRGHFWGIEIVKCGVDVPAVEARVGEVVGFRDCLLVEGSVMRMLEFEVFEAFVGRNEAVTNDLDFGLMRYGLQVRVEDALLAVNGLAVPVALGLRVKAVGQFELSFGRAAALILEDYDVMLIQRIADNREVIV